MLIDNRTAAMEFTDHHIFSFVDYFTSYVSRKHNMYIVN